MPTSLCKDHDHPASTLRWRTRLTVLGNARSSSHVSRLGRNENAPTTRTSSVSIETC
jgi:hypothetical protein